MIDAAPYQLKIINAILQKHVPYCEVRAFGSRVTWTAKDYSDLDLAIIGKKRLADKILYALKEDFEESDLPFRVDVLDWNIISKEFQTVINRNYEVLQKNKTKFKETEIGKIPEDWDIEFIGDICQVKSGKRLPKGHSLTEDKTNHPYIRVRNLSNGSVKVNELLHIEDETYEKISRYIIKKDDVYISIVGTIGLVGTIPPMIGGANLTENCARLTNIKKTSNKWLSYYLNSARGQEQIKAYTVGTTQGKLALFRIKKIQIPSPCFAEQCAITKILSDLDLRIGLNQQMNKTLEAIGQALFKRWFVDFEFPCLPQGYKPFGAGKPDDIEKVYTYKAVGGLPAPVSGKHFIYVLLCNDESFYIGITDDIYRRWYEHKTGQGAKWTKANEPVKVIHYEEFKNRKEAAEREAWLKTGFGRKWLKREYDKYLKRKAVLPAPECQLRQAGEMVGSELGYIPKGWRIKNIGEVISFEYGKALKEEKREKGNVPVYGSNGQIGWHNERLVDGPGIIIGRKGNPGIVTWSNTDFFPIDTAFYVIPKNKISIHYIFFALKNQRLDLISADSAVPGLNRNIAYMNRLMIPKEGVIKKFDIYMKSITKIIQNNNEQNISLISIRDSLLPRLMSGRIRVEVGS